jgi:hypothetical protein
MRSELRLLTLSVCLGIVSTLNIYCASYSVSLQAGLCKGKTYNFKSCLSTAEFSPQATESIDQTAYALERYNCSDQIDSVCKSILSFSAVSDNILLRFEVIMLTNLPHRQRTHRNAWTCRNVLAIMLLQISSILRLLFSVRKTKIVHAQTFSLKVPRLPTCAVPVRHAGPTRLRVHHALLHQMQRANAMPDTMATALSAALANDAQTRTDKLQTHAVAGIRTRRRVAHATQATIFKRLKQAACIIFLAPVARGATRTQQPPHHARAEAQAISRHAHATRAIMETDLPVLHVNAAMRTQFLQASARVHRTQ